VFTRERMLLKVSPTPEAGMFFRSKQETGMSFQSF
jgi:hypothetical protein